MDQDWKKTAGKRNKGLNIDIDIISIPPSAPNIYNSEGGRKSEP